MCPYCELANMLESKCYKHGSRSCEIIVTGLAGLEPEPISEIITISGWEDDGGRSPPTSE